jgi:NADPH-dependent curcumin reductase CurA
MATGTNQQILLVSRPQAEPSAENFRLVTSPIPDLADGQVLVRNRWLSLDPYMRGRMSDRKSYAAPQPLNQVMIGGTAGEVVESRHHGFAPGDTVIGTGGWQQYAVFDATQRGVLRRVDARSIPLSAYLGAVGMPGVTAWYGLVKVIAPKQGDTVVVSAASGAVGSVVGQLAKLRGARAVGIAGGPDKCRHVTEVLGFDACIDHRAHPDTASLAAAFAQACPNGIDGDFENVGGRVLDAVMQCMNPFGRIAVCGMIAGYNGEPIPMAEPQRILTQRLRVEGFIIGEHLDVWAEALEELGTLVAAGRLVRHESIVDGLENAPEAFFGLLQGRNLGKQLVRL